MTSIIIHYAEIGIKKGNRAYFERRLIQNIQQKTGYKPKRNHGCLVIEDLDASNAASVEKLIAKTPGVANLSLSTKCGLELDAIIQTAEKIIETGKSFKVITQRSNKDFPLTSQETNQKVGEYFFDRGWKVDIHHPDQQVFVDILSKNAYISSHKKKGIGGLPTGTEGKVLSLISGGIDSPVASYLMAKRGARVEFIHFHNERAGGYDKIVDLVTMLSEVQGPSVLYVVPFNQIQNQIIIGIPPEWRMLTYRRVMSRIADEVGKQIRAKGIVTGDSLGQVASQTLDNLFVIRQSFSLPVYSPLIGMDKTEIMAIARDIGTYDISIRPYADCCSYLIARHPQTRATMSEMLELEKNVNINALVEAGLKNLKEIRSPESAKNLL